MDTTNDADAVFLNFGMAAAAGIKASRRGVEDWTAKDERVAFLAATESLKAWLLLNQPTSGAN